MPTKANISAPYRVLEITTSSKCSINCSYCPQRVLKSNLEARAAKTRLFSSTFFRCLNSVPNSVDISFAGFTEPWLNPECTDMIEYVAKKGHSLRVFTTLIGMTEEDVKRLSSLSYKVFVVHLFDDGNYMNSKFITDQYLSVLRLIIDSKIQPLKFLIFGRAHESVSRIVPNEKLVDSRPLISRAGNVETSVINKLPTIQGRIECMEMRQFRNVLLPNGDVALCCMDYGGKHILGNLLVDEYESLHQGEEFMSVIAKMRGASGSLICRSCEYALGATNDTGK